MSVGSFKSTAAKVAREAVVLLGEYGSGRRERASRMTTEDILSHASHVVTPGGELVLI